MPSTRQNNNLNLLKPQWQAWLNEISKEEPEPARGGCARSDGLCSRMNCSHIVAEAYLTPKEYLCVRELLQGQTLAVAAKNLQLSSRTVEYYCNNVKRKFKCKKKKELLALLRGRLVAPIIDEIKR